LVRLAKENMAYSSRVKCLHQAYRLNYIGSFGGGILKRPLAITADWDGQGLIVADYGHNRIFHFDDKGLKWQELDIPAHLPISIFRDDKKLVWICNRGTACLTAVDRRHRIVRSIPLEKVFPSSESLRYPAHACRMGHHLFVIVMDEHHQKRRLVVLEDRPPFSWREIVPTNGMGIPDGILKIGTDLYVTDIEPGIVFKYAQKMNAWSQFVNKGPLPNSPRRCATAGKFIFMTAGKTVAKHTRCGQEIFVARLDRIVGYDEIQPISVASLGSQGRRYLYVSDVSTNACIYRFEI
jgi:hypothetical protein